MSSPRRVVAVIIDVEHCDVGHHAVRRRAMPMFFVGLEENAVTGTNLFDGPASAPTPADPLRT